MPKIEDRRFVVFGSAIVQVDLIVAVVVAEKNGRPIIVMVLENGSSVSVEDDVSMALFQTWWAENMKPLTEKIELPEVVVPPEPATIVTPPLATAPTPVQPPPELTPELSLEPIETPEALLSAISQVAPEPPPPQPTKPLSLDDIGKG